MARVDEVRPWNLPIAFLVPKGRRATLGDIIDWNKQNPNPIQKLTYLTLGGIIAIIFGTAVSIRKENLWGAILAVLGIGTTVTGIICAPDTSEETKPTESLQKELKDKKEEELIGIIKSGEKTWRERKDAALELGRRKVQSAVNALIELSKEIHFKLREAAAKALGDIGAKEAQSRLQELSTNDCPTVKKAADEAIKKLNPATT